MEHSPTKRQLAVHKQAVREERVDRSPDQASASDRARWLTDLAEAIVQAQRVAWALGIAEGDDPDAKELYGRLESARVEVESLRHGRWSRPSSELNPIWTKLLAGEGVVFGPTD
jgi:hypothetical protein